MEAVISARGARGEAIGGARRRSQRQLIAAEWREIAATGSPLPNQRSQRKLKNGSAKQNMYPFITKKMKLWLYK